MSIEWDRKIDFSGNTDLNIILFPLSYGQSYVFTHLVLIVTFKVKIVESGISFQIGEKFVFRLSRFTQFHKSVFITEVFVPTFFLHFAKVTLGISMIDLSRENISMKLNRCWKLKNKFLFNLRCRSTPYEFYFENYDQNQISKNTNLYVDKLVY